MGSLVLSIKSERAKETLIKNLPGFLFCFFVVIIFVVVVATLAPGNW